MTTDDLREELAKAEATFSQWPEWKQTVLRDSMRGKVLTPRHVSSKNAECDTKVVGGERQQGK